MPVKEETSFFWANLFYLPSPCGAGSALPKKGCLITQDAAEWCRRLQVDNQATNVLSHLHAGLRLMASSDIFHLPLPPRSHCCRALSVLLVVERGRVLRPALRSFKVKFSTRKLTPPFKPKVHLPGPSKLGR